MKENIITSKKFTYSLPDDYLYQTNEKQLSATYTYTGPDKLWVFVWEDTGKVVGPLYYTEKEDGNEIPTPKDQIKVFIDANKTPLIATMFCDNTDRSTLSIYEEILPDGSVYSRHKNTTPDHTYEFDELTYDIENSVWKEPLPWKKPFVTWDNIKQARNSMLAATDTVLMTKILSDEQKVEIEQIRQKIRDLPDTFSGIDPWKVPFPQLPQWIGE